MKTTINRGQRAAIQTAKRGGIIAENAVRFLIEKANACTSDTERVDYQCAYDEIVHLVGQLHHAEKEESK